MTGDPDAPPKAPPDTPVTVIVCVKDRFEGSPSCGGRGSRALIAALRDNLERHGETVIIQEVQCLGRCTIGPNMRLKGGAFFTGMTRDRLGEVREAIAAHRRGEGATADPGMAWTPAVARDTVVSAPIADGANRS